MKTENQGLIHFLEVYESENYAERLHQALYYVAGQEKVNQIKKSKKYVEFYIKFAWNSMICKPDIYVQKIPYRSW